MRDEPISERGHVPDAPFKKNWHELAFKRALTEAVNDPSIERLTWTTGAVQADRYNLAKQVESVYWKPDTEEFNAILKGGADSIERVVSREQLPEVIGKEAAERLLDAPRNDFGSHVLEGADLEMGGEFHKNLYDKKITQFAKKFLKKYGVEPQRIGTETDREALQMILDDTEKRIKKWHQDARNISAGERWQKRGQLDNLTELQAKKDRLEERIKNTENLWYIDITPEMREEIMTQGVPLTQRRKQMGLMAGYA